MPSSLIHPFSCMWTIMPLGIFPYRNVFLLKMIIGGSFVPSAQQARTTVKCVFSWPLVLTATVFAPLMSTVLVGWHIKCESDLIHIGDLGQLKVMSLSKNNNIRMKFQNLIIIGCWKFGGKFHLCLRAQTFSLHKVKAPFRCSWEILNVFFSCNPFTFFLYHLGQNRDPSLTLLQNPGLHLLTSTWFGSLLLIAFFCLVIWRTFLPVVSTIW